MSQEQDQNSPFTDDNSEPEKAAKSDILAYAKSVWDCDRMHWDPIFDAGRDDLQILSDDPSAQWDPKIWKERVDSGRPVTTVDYLSQFIHQVANGIRMQTPSINVIPAGGKASIKKAEMLKAAIRKIEYRCSADTVYDTGATSAVKCSIGFARVDHSFANKKGFDQQLDILRVVNPFMIYMDSTTIELDGCDQKHCTVLEKIKVSEYKRRWPDADICGYGEKGDDQKTYSDDDDVIVAEFFKKDTEETVESAKTNNGKEVTRKSSKSTIRRAWINDNEVLEETWFPGEYIPVIPFFGEEAWIDGERHLFSLIRKSKSSQRSLNLKKSIEDELLMKQPLAPVLVPAGAIENYKDDWQNPGKSMALRYDQTNSDGSIRYDKPERLLPPQASSGFMQATAQATDDIKATMGIYSNSLGQQGQEVSGRAINARKIQADVATYHFGDNTVRSITMIGKVLVSAWNEIYDTAREVDGINAEDKPITFGINGKKVDGQDDDYDFSDDTYDTRVTTGASYTTVRQESAEFYQDIVKQSPEMLQICGDLMFENMDVAGAQAMASRMKKIIKPELLEEDGKEQDPQVQALQGQLQQAQQIIQQGAQAMQEVQKQLDDKNQAIMVKAELENKKIEAKSANDAANIQLQQMQQSLDSQKAETDRMFKMMQAMMQGRSLDITEQKNAGDLAVKASGQDFQQLMAMVTQIQAQLAPPTDLPAGDTATNNGAGLEGI